MRHKYHLIPVLLIAGITLSTGLSGCKKKDMSLKLNEPRNIKGVISYKRSFGDLNEKHLKTAQAIGIRPLASREEAEEMKERLRHITTNERYAVDSLTHSIPYLIPGAANLSEKEISLEKRSTRKERQVMTLLAPLNPAMPEIHPRLFSYMKLEI